MRFIRTCLNGGGRSPLFVFAAVYHKYMNRVYILDCVITWKMLPKASLRRMNEWQKKDERIHPNICRWARKYPFRGNIANERVGSDDDVIRLL